MMGEDDDRSRGRAAGRGAAGQSPQPSSLDSPCDALGPWQRLLGVGFSQESSPSVSAGTDADAACGRAAGSSAAVRAA